MSEISDAMHATYNTIFKERQLRHTHAVSLSLILSNHITALQIIYNKSHLKSLKFYTLPPKYRYYFVLSQKESISDYSNSNLHVVQ